VDLRVFDLLYGGTLAEVGNDTLHGYNVQTVALQVPSKQLAPKQPIIGIWSDTQRRTATGWYTQVSRLGMPLVNEVVIALKDKDRFNASKPRNDAQFGKYVTNPELPKLIQSIYKIPAPATPRKDLVQVFLTGVPGLNQPPNVRPAEMIRLNTSIPPSMDPQRLGVLAGDKAGFPNGRRLTDDVVDISLQVVEGKLLGAKIPALADAVNANDKAFGGTFPYVALPWSGSDVTGSGSGIKPAAASVAGNPRVNQLNASTVADENPTTSSRVLPMAAIGVGALFLRGAGALFWLRRPRLPSDCPLSLAAQARPPPAPPPARHAAPPRLPPKAGPARTPSLTPEVDPVHPPTTPPAPVMRPNRPKPARPLAGRLARPLLTTGLVAALAAGLTFGATLAT